MNVYEIIHKKSRMPYAVIAAHSAWEALDMTRPPGKYRSFDMSTEFEAIEKTEPELILLFSDFRADWSNGVGHVC